MPLELSYEAGAGCPSRSDLEAELTARDLPHRAPTVGEAATRLRIRVSAGPTGPAHGEVEVRLLTGEVTSRSLSGPTCSEVLRSLTLVAALALAPLSAGPPARPTPSALPPAASPSGPPASSAPPSPASATPPPSASPPGSSVPVRAAPGAAPTATWTLGLQAGLQSALSPDPSPGGSLWVERRPRSGVALRLTAGGWSGGTTDAGPYRATFRAYLAQLSGCWPLASGRWLASACGLLQGGWLTAEGQGSDETRGQQRRTWLAPGAGARAGVRIGDRGWIEAAGAALVPLRRDRFLFEQPRVEAHHVGAVAWQATLGVGVDLR